MREMQNAGLTFPGGVSSFAQTPQCEAPTFKKRAAHPAHPLIEGLRTVQAPSILQGESRTRLLQGIAIGAVASMVIGFSFGGWVTGPTANKLAAEQASTAVVKVLTPICVEKFMQNGDAQANLAALRNITSNWQQGDYLEKGGWATRPGATSPDYELGRACAAKLIEAKAASQ
jgi:hypothetical protein